MILLAILIGIIPDSGPHLLFVTLFATGTVPFSVLLASSISQDGHAALPLLAESKRSFVKAKISTPWSQRRWVIFVTLSVFKFIAS